jgi:hypothetical protein
MRRVKISELKAHLSEYLRAAQAGEQILVCDRETPVALFGPPFVDDEFDDVVIIPPERPMFDWSTLGLKVRPVPPGSIQEALDEVREDRF